VGRVTVRAGAVAPSSRTSRGEQAIAANQEAAYYETVPRTSLSDHEYYPWMARHMRAQADALLEPPADLQVSAGEAITWDNRLGEAAPGETARIIETLEHPTSVSTMASGKRMRAALAADILEPAIDAAQSAQASNSIEKMLCHQMAAAHFCAMRLIERSARSDLPPVEVARLTNAAARQMEVYQAGSLVLQKLKTRGTQRVLVQYQQVNVANGGQALVAGRVRGSRNRGRGRSKNG
jgi:hypothetical protein